MPRSGVILTLAGRRHWPSRARAGSRPYRWSIRAAIARAAVCQRRRRQRARHPAGHSGSARWRCWPMGREPLLIAAIASLGDPRAADPRAARRPGAHQSDYPLAGVMGAVVFLVALAAWPVANRLRESEALVRRQEVDLANLAQLSQYIVQHLRESILVVDPRDRIRLINESAAQMLGDRVAVPGALLGEVSPRLLYLLSTWRAGQDAAPLAGEDPRRAEPGTIVAADGARVIEPHFAPLGHRTAGAGAGLPGGHRHARRDGAAVEARGAGAAQRQHRARDPQSGRRDEPRRAAAGGIRHAGRGRPPAHRDHAQQRAARQRHHRQRAAALAPRAAATGAPAAGRVVRGFREEFCETLQCRRPGSQVIGDAGIEVARRPRPAAPDRLEPVRERAQARHGPGRRARRCGSASAGWPAAAGRSWKWSIAVRASAPPTSSASSSPSSRAARAARASGLFLARELAESNAATLLYEPREGGGSLFRLVFADPRRWAAASCSALKSPDWPPAG